MKSVRDINEPRHHPHFVRATVHAPFEHVTNLELPSNLTHIHVFVLERKGGGARDDQQTVNVREGVDDLLGDPVAEIILISRLAQIDEGKNGDALSGDVSSSGTYRRAISTETP